MNIFQKFKLDLIFSSSRNIWERFKDLGAVLQPCRFSVIMLLVALLFLLLAPQGQDVLRDLAEWEGGFSAAFGKLFLFFAAMLAWALNVWYWARVMLKFSFAEPRGLSEKQKIRQQRMRKYVPRTLGVLAFLAVGGAFFKASYAYPENDPGGVASTLGYLALACMAGALLFYLFTAVRRPAARALRTRLLSAPTEKQAHYRPLIEVLDVDSGDQAYTAQLHSIKDISAVSRKVLWASMLLSLLLFLLFWIWPTSAAFFGAATILLLAASSWVPFGSMVVYWACTAGFPIMTALLGIAILFSLWNDNHAIRTLQESVVSQNGTTESVSEHFPRWLQQGLERWPTDSKQPVFIVAAEGGGIRAGYWTSIVLSALQDRDDKFSDHLYGISGVSGGSLGAAVFAALLKEQGNNRELNCPAGSADKNGGPLQRCAHQLLSEDFLAPTVAYMLYPDLVQRILPFPVASFDRSRALETSWEKSWYSRFGNERFERAFHELWQGEEQRIPALFFNSTWVETGKRVITSNLKIDPEIFVDSVDFFEVIEQEVRLSTAVHNSARFTYVSPAGTLVQSDGRVWGHLVDGGYFENSGAATAYELLTAMKQSVDPAVWDRITPVVIMISNDPALVDGQPPQRERFMTEVLSPLKTLLNTRNARGSYSRAALRDLVEDQGGRFVHVALRGGGGPLPLGWVLSDIAKQTMQQQLQQMMNSGTAELLATGGPRD